MIEAAARPAHPRCAAYGGGERGRLRVLHRRRRGGLRREEPVAGGARIWRGELFLRPRGIDAAAAGAIAGRYEFRHALYRQVLYERMSATRRVRLHRRIGEWRGASRALVHEHAASWPLHFEEGTTRARGAPRRRRGEGAMRKHAYHEATALLGRALDLLAGLPQTADHRRQELSLRMALGTSLLTTRGYAAPEVKHAYGRARQLCRHMEDGPELFFRSPACSGSSSCGPTSSSPPS
jgi:hypothetical protein